jgi:hypothetical protein
MSDTIESGKAKGNDTRWGGFRAFATLLGFAWETPRTLFPDPTTVLRDELQELFGGEETLLQEEFFRRLALRVPVLDHGVYRVEIERSLKQRYQTRSEKGAVSASLSRAMFRLQAEGDITWERKSDSLSLAQLTMPNTLNTIAISHISLETK